MMIFAAEELPMKCGYARKIMGMFGGTITSAIKAVSSGQKFGKTCVGAD
jgi:hypothetical protein